MEISEFAFKINKSSRSKSNKRKRDSSTSLDPKKKNDLIIIDFKNIDTKKENKFTTLISSSQMSLTPGYQNHRRSLFSQNSKNIKVNIIKEFKDINHLKFCDLNSFNLSAIDYNDTENVISINSFFEINLLKFDFYNKLHFFQKFQRINENKQFFLSGNFFKNNFSNLMLIGKTNGRVLIEDFYIKKNLFRSKIPQLLKSFAFQKKFCLVNNKKIKFYDIRDPLTTIYDFDKIDTKSIYQIKKKSNLVLISNQETNFLFDVRKPDKSLSLNVFRQEKKKNWEPDNFKKMFFLENKNRMISFNFSNNELDYLDLENDRKTNIDTFNENFIDVALNNSKNQNQLILLTEKDEKNNQSVITYKIENNTFFPYNEIMFENSNYKKIRFFGADDKIIIHDNLYFKILSQSERKYD